eukprot:scaffold6578_cov141-Skeletonema_marinoi.AAC.22
MNNDHVEPYDIIREPSPMISDSGETSSERGERGSMKALAAAATTTSNERSPSQKAVIINEDDADIYIPTQNSNGSGSGNRVPAVTVNGRSPRLQGQTGALLNRADPLSLSNSGPTTALNIMRRSGGRSNSDTTSGSGGASNQDGRVPRSVVTSTVSPPSSATPVISNVDRCGGNHGERNSNSGMPPTTAMDYRPSQIYGMGQGGGGGYPQHTNAHDIHRARWEQEQRELAADYYPSANNYPFDYYNSPGSMGMYYQQQQLNQPPPASLRYRQQQMPAETNAAADRLAMEHRLQVEQRLQEYYQPRVPHQVPPSMVVLPHQAQAAQLQQQHQQQQQQRAGGADSSKPPARSSSPGVSSTHCNQVHQQLQRSGSPGVTSVNRNQVHHRRTQSQQQQQSPHAYEERDWRTNQVWREDDHSHTASLGGLKIPTPPPSAINTTERGTSDKPSAGMPSVTSLPPRMQQQPSQQQGRVSGSMTIDQYDITHAQMYGQYMQDLQQQQQQAPPPHASATPSPPPGPMPPPSTPIMTGMDPRVQHQMNLMAMMFQHQQGGGIPPPHISPIPRGLMYPQQYYAPQHNFYQGGIPGAVGQQPPMPREVIVPNPSVTAAETAAGTAADSNVPSPYHGPEPTVAPSPISRDKSSKTKVTFSHLQIRTYETILGDNPSCTGGPSLSIGWRYNPEHFDSTVDEYERKQDELYGGPGIRPLDIDLVLHRTERESILMKMGYTQSDLAEAVRRLNKAKSRRRQTVHNLPVMFLEEKAESCKRSVGRLFLNRQRTRHMYDEWKKSDKGKRRETRRNSV